MFTKRQKAVVQLLANGLFPLQTWHKEKQHCYDPVKEKHYKEYDVPWRTSDQKLRVECTGAIEFLETVIRDSSGTESLLDHWRKIDNDPFRFCPIPDVLQWRADRGLTEDPGNVRFGAVEVKNVWPGGGSQPKSKTHPESRRQFYARYLDLLVDTAETRRLDPADDRKWVKFADELLSDNCKEWPEAVVGPSSVFVEQLGRDLLYAMMNMTTPEKDPWRSALLVELGEHRRPGNAFVPSDCDKAIEALEDKIEKIKSKSKKQKQTD